MVVGKEVLNFHIVISFYMPQYCIADTQGLSPSNLPKLQIKNIKLHIVTDIKVTFNSMLGFRISLFGWGDGYFIILKKILPFMVAISFIITYSYCHAMGLQMPLIWPQFCIV